MTTKSDHHLSAGSEPAAWSYELAHASGTRGYSDWQKHITETKPNVPEASIRNLRPLYLNEPQEARVTAEVQEALATALKAWDAYGGFDSREDTANKANAMAKAIRAYLAPHLSTGELK
jgi:hypothetical protein